MEARRLKKMEPRRVGIQVVSDSHPDLHCSEKLGPNRIKVMRIRNPGPRSIHLSLPRLRITIRIGIF
jgi:hypothetical protein